MKLKDIADMEDYLENRCYCPHEIYDMTGFFYELFFPETECTFLISGSKGGIHGVFVIAKPDMTGYKPKEQIIYIDIIDDRVNACVRFDNTQNNRKQIKKYMNGEIDVMSFDEYDVGNTQKNIDEIMSVTDAICVS